MLTSFLAQHEDTSQTEVSISRITRDKYDRLLQENGYQRKTIVFDVALDGSQDIPAFQWTKSDEFSQSKEYLDWLKLHVQLPEDMQYYPSFADPDLLTTSCASAQYLLKGTIDVAVVSKIYVDSWNTPSGIRVAIELKKNAAPEHVMQAVTQLLSATAKSNFKVVVLLTDLKDHFQFFWLHQNYIVDCKYLWQGCALAAPKLAVHDVFLV